MKKLALLIGACLPVAGFADYQSEITAGYAHIETESQLYSDGKYQDSYSSWNLGGSFFFQPVNVSNVPLSDAAFLAQASNASIAHARSDWEEFEETESLFELQWIFSQGTILGASYGDSELGDDDETETLKGPGIIVGHYITPSSAVRLHYQKAKLTLDTDYFFYDDLTQTQEIYTLSYKNLVMSEDNANADIEIEASKSSEYTDFSAKLGWFSGNQIKYGVIAGLTDHEYAYIDRRRIGLWAEWFVLNNLAFTAQYLVESGKESDDFDYRFQEATTSLQVKYRL